MHPFYLSFFWAFFIFGLYLVIQTKYLKANTQVITDYAQLCILDRFIKHKAAPPSHNGYTEQIFENKQVIPDISWLTLAAHLFQARSLYAQT